MTTCAASDCVALVVPPRRKYCGGRCQGREYMRTYRREHPDHVRNTNLRAAYGVSLERYQEMWAAQVGVCAVCRRPDDPLEVDHCHATGVVRALLCGQCNRALGQAEDDPDRLRALASYIEARP